jgi:hypothetical protein
MAADEERRMREEARLAFLETLRKQALAEKDSPIRRLARRVVLFFMVHEPPPPPPAVHFGEDDHQRTILQTEKTHNPRLL